MPEASPPEGDRLRLLSIRQLHHDARLIVGSCGGKRGQYGRYGNGSDLVRRISVFRDGNMMAAMIGPDLVVGIAGFGETVAAALRDLAEQFTWHGYALDVNSVSVKVCDETLTARGTTAPDAIRRLAGVIEWRGYAEHDFAEPDWSRIAAERPITS